MKRQFRDRAFLPIVLPIAVVLGIGAVVAGFALILLYNTRLTAIVLAALMAGGVLVAVSLAASRDRLGGMRRMVVLAAGATPVVLGALLALGVFGVLPEEQLNINREPHTVIPEGAPVIGAVNSQNFCAPTDGDCATTQRMEMPPGQEITVVFENRDDVVHNWTMRPSEGSSEIIAQTPDGTGELTATVPPQEPGDYFFVCTIHPNMTGTAAVSEDISDARVVGGEGSAGGGGS